MENALDLPLAGAELLDRLAEEERLYLFLDYDGTLAEFSPTPDTILPDPGLVRLMTELIALPGVRVATVSGRRLEHIIQLLPIPGLAIAGTYGLEIRSPQGEVLVREGLEGYRRYLELLKPELEDLLDGLKGFYLEDKTWSLAIHARYAPLDEVVAVFSQAKELALALGLPEGMHFLGGDRFMEISPRIADKGQAVLEIYRRFHLEGALPVYFGDDDKDEAGFQVVDQMRGESVVVTTTSQPTYAAYRLPAPAEVRGWLRELIERRLSAGG